MRLCFFFGFNILLIYFKTFLATVRALKRGCQSPSVSFDVCDVRLCAINVRTRIVHYFALKKFRAVSFFFVCLPRIALKPEY